MTDVPRVAIVSHRFATFGGIQTCVSEVIAGLNARGIVPEILWDTPPSPDFATSSGLQYTFGQRRLPINSDLLAGLPGVFRARLSPLQMQLAKVDFNGFDFVYSFAPGLRMPPGLPNLCYTCGPPYISMPDEEIGLKVLGSWRRFRVAVHRVTTPSTKLDRNSRYVTLSTWIAERFRSQLGCDLPVIWPPTKSRKHQRNARGERRSGFLFFSRILDYKRPCMMLDIAERFPGIPVTIAGASAVNSRFVDSLKRDTSSRNIKNLRFVENPSEENVADLLASHSFFVFPAAWEHFGIVTVEAIEAGLIPLVHDTGGQKEIVPFPELRFSNRSDLIDRAEFVLKEHKRLRSEVLPELRDIATRGSAETFRAEMLRYLDVDLRDRHSCPYTGSTKQ